MHAPRPAADDGFGLVEVVVSMLVLGILVAASAPLVVQSMLVTARNNTIATATRLFNERVEDARALASSTDCATLLALVDGPVVSHTDGRGVRLDVDSASVGTCQPGGLLGLTVTVSTTSSGFSNPVLVEGTTEILVKGA